MLDGKLQKKSKYVHKGFKYRRMKHSNATCSVFICMTYCHRAEDSVQSPQVA